MSILERNTKLKWSGLMASIRSRLTNVRSGAADHSGVWIWTSSCMAGKVTRPADHLRRRFGVGVVHRPWARGAVESRWTGLV